MTFSTFTWGKFPVVFPQIKVSSSKSTPYSITSIGHVADPGFLAVINLVADCRYFPPGLWLLSQANRSPPSRYHWVKVLSLYQRLQQFRLQNVSSDMQ